MEEGALERAEAVPAAAASTLDSSIFTSMLAASRSFNLFASGVAVGLLAGGMPRLLGSMVEAAQGSQAWRTPR